MFAPRDAQSHRQVLEFATVLGFLFPVWFRVLVWDYYIVW